MKYNKFDNNHNPILTDKQMKNIKCDKIDKSGFEPYPDYVEQCLDMCHNPPMHLYIAPGQQYRHVCPTCGQVTILKGNNISW